MELSSTVDSSTTAPVTTTTITKTTTNLDPTSNTENGDMVAINLIDRSHHGGGGGGDDGIIAAAGGDNSEDDNDTKVATLLGNSVNTVMVPAAVATSHHSNLKILES